MGFQIHIHRYSWISLKNHMTCMTRMNPLFSWAVWILSRDFFLNQHNMTRLQIHTAHEKIGFIRVIQVIWILTEIHEYLWIWIWKPMNFYECEYVNSWISMTMNAKSHEFPWIWKNIYELYDYEFEEMLNYS